MTDVPYRGAADERARGRKEKRTGVAEWAAAAVGLALTLGMLGTLALQAMQGADQVPPAVAVQKQGVSQVEGVWVVEFVAVNRSPTTAANVDVVGRVMRGEETVAESRASLDYVPGRSNREGGLFFPVDPNGLELELRAEGYAAP